MAPSPGRPAGPDLQAAGWSLALPRAMLQGRTCRQQGGVLFLLILLLLLLFLLILLLLRLLALLC